MTTESPTIRLPETHQIAEFERALANSLNIESHKENPNLDTYSKIYKALVDGTKEDYSKIFGVLIFYDHIMNDTKHILEDLFPDIRKLLQEVQHQIALDILRGNVSELVAFAERNPTIFDEYSDSIIIMAFNKTLNNFSPIHKYLSTANLPICSYSHLENVLADQLEEFEIPVDRERLPHPGKSCGIFIVG